MVADHLVVLYFQLRRKGIELSIVMNVSGEVRFIREREVPYVNAQREHRAITGFCGYSNSRFIISWRRLPAVSWNINIHPDRLVALVRTYIIEQIGDIEGQNIRLREKLSC